MARGSLLALITLAISAWMGSKVVKRYADRSRAKVSSGVIGLRLLAGLTTAAGLL